MLKYFFVCTNRRKYNKNDIKAAAQKGPHYNTYKEAFNIMNKCNDDCDYDVFSIDENNVITKCEYIREK